jgi:hypothetical protein
MAKTRAFVVHDELGNIISISRPTPGDDRRKVIVLSGEGQSILSTELDADAAQEILQTHHVNVDRQALIKSEKDSTY